MWRILFLSDFMPKVAFLDSYTSIWRGKDCLSLIDGLSCNKVSDLEKGGVIQTAIINNHAKIIDFVTVEFFLMKRQHFCQNIQREERRI